MIKRNVKTLEERIAAVIVARQLDTVIDVLRNRLEPTEYREVVIAVASFAEEHGLRLRALRSGRASA